MASQEEPNEVDAAMQHLRVKGLYSRGHFSEPFPGLYPTVAQRRRYMRAFFQWHLCDAEPEEHEHELREHAERKIASVLIEGHRVGVQTIAYEFAVDEKVWQSWFSRCPKESIPAWPWPFPKIEEGDNESSKFAELLAKYEREGTLFPSSTEPTNIKVEDNMSSNSIVPTEKSGEATHVAQRSKPAALTATGVEPSFATTMTGRTNVPQSGLESTISAPETRVVPPTASATTAPTGSVSAEIQPSVPTSVMATSSQAARPPVKPTEATLPPTTQQETDQTASMGLSKIAGASQRAPVKFTEVGDKLYPYPCTPPDLRLRVMLWASNLPRIQPPYQVPFKLLLPADFGFWSLVWGPNGKDWLKIQRQFVDERVCLAWGYEEAYVGTTRKAHGYFQDDDLPNVMQWISVGFVSKGNENEDGFFMTDAPTNQKLVLKLWTALNSWMKDCLSGQWTTLLSYLQRIEDRDIGEGSIAKACNALPSGYVAGRTQYTSQRKTAEKNLKAMIRSSTSAFEGAKPLLETWVDSFEEGYAMTRRDRIELAALIWRLGVRNTWHMKITDWAAGMQRK
ncbi:hypothetical protein ACHAP7_002540 [Fusarium lateritium]